MKKIILLNLVIFILLTFGCKPENKIQEKSIEDFKINEIQETIANAKLEVPIENLSNVKTEKTFDFNGDGIKDTAQVSLGTGGAYTNYYSFVMVDNDNLKMALFKDKGNLKPRIFWQGASVKNEAIIYINEALKVITQIEIESDDQGNKTYKNFERYRFNISSGIFELQNVMP